MLIRHAFALASLVLIIETSSQARAESNFTCDEKACVCNPAVAKDCDNMKINCAGGKISNCVPLDDGNFCTCSIGSVKSKPSRAEIQALVKKQLLKKTQ